MKYNKTLLIIKPDAVKKKVVGQIISILEVEFSIVDMKLLSFSENLAKDFYSMHSKKPFYSELVNFIISGPVIALILQGDESIISRVRLIIGHTNFLEATPSSIRGKFGSSLTENAVHASDCYDSFLKESLLIFNKVYD